MKKGAFNFLSRKNQSLFDTNIKIKEMDHMELVLDSSTIPESGTAKVRSRPGVRHHNSSGDNLLGFAVPTPTVPVLLSHNGLQTNGSVIGDHLSNGSVISVPDLVEGEILVPPPPSMAPPPPPSMAPPPPLKQFIPPPPDFMGDLDSADFASLQPPTMPPPKPPSQVPSRAMSLKDDDLTHIKPPPMAPPKPPTNSSKASTPSLPRSTSPIVPDLSECPNFAPPQPPSVKYQKNQKTPPPKPIRLSSMGSLDALAPQASAPYSPVQSQTHSSFNPKSTENIYVPKTSVVSGIPDHDTGPKQMLILEDSESVNSMVPKQVNGKVPSVASPSKPVVANSSGVQLEKVELKEKGAKRPLPTSQLQPQVSQTETVATQQEINKPVQLSPQVSPTFRKDLVSQSILDSNQMKMEQSVQIHQVSSSSKNRSYGPLIDRKLRNLRGSETSGTREGPAASPFALLMAAKEREKQRSSISCVNSSRNNEEPCASIQPSDSNYKSFIVTPKSTSSPTLNPQGLEDSPRSVVPVALLEPKRTQTSEQHRSVTLNSNTQSTPAISSIKKQPVIKEHTVTEGLPNEDNRKELHLGVLPPPPEFANFEDLEEFTESPPNSPAPDPPAKKAHLPRFSTAPSVQAPPTPKPPSPPKAPLPHVSTAPSVQAPPTPKPPSPPKAPLPHVSTAPSVQAPPTPKPPSPPKAPLPHVSTAPSGQAPPTPMPPPPPKAPLPKFSTAPSVQAPPSPMPPPPPNLPLPYTDSRQSLPLQTKSKVAPTQPPSSLSASQATLLSILQKKMLEMDHKLAPMQNTEALSDDWGSPVSDEEMKFPVVSEARLQNNTLPSKTTSLDMRELESKVAKKYQDTSSSKGVTSNGLKSKHQYGMTFTVRPGTKEPITLVSKGDSK